MSSEQGQQAGQQQGQQQQQRDRRGSLRTPQDGFLIAGADGGTAKVAQGPKVKAVADIIRTEDRISLSDMQNIRKRFEEHNNSLELETLTEVLKEFLEQGPDFAERVSILFKKMDTNQNGRIEWDEFISHFMADLQEKHLLRNEREIPLLVCPHMVESPHRGNLCRVMATSSPARLISASDEGTLCFWTLKMQLQRVLTLSDVRQTKQVVITDVVILPNAYRVAVATTNRDLCFYEIATGMLCNRLVGLADIITDLDYTALSNERGLLVWGDMAGNVTILELSQTATRLFDNSDATWGDGVTLNIRGLKSSDPEAPARITHIKAHRPELEEVDRSVKRVEYVPVLDSVISCAATSKSSVVIRDIKRPDVGGFSFNVHKGCNSFAFSPEVNLLATAGGDGLVRLWNPYVPTHPVAELHGHSAPIMHVVFNMSYNQVISVCANEAIRIWDVQDHVCLNALVGLIPHRSTQRKAAISALLWHEPTQSLITGCRDELTITQMARQDTSRATITTHQYPVTCVLYLPEFGHVMTADLSGSLVSWNLATGERLVEYSNIHGDSSISCLTSTHHGCRIISGASDGTVKVWNTFSGALLAELTKGNDKEISAIIPTPMHYFVSSWDGAIQCYDARSDSAKIQPDPLWTPDHSHKGDILTMDFCPEALLATGSIDGEVIIWNTNLMKAVLRLSAAEGGAQDLLSDEPKLRASKAHLFTTQTAVDKVMWLKHRALRRERRRGGSLLVSSAHGGHIFFWDTHKGRVLGQFCAAHSKLGSEGVRALATGAEDSMLLTGDTQGYVNIYDISSYCTEDVSTQLGEARPPVLATWRAHVQAISTIVFAAERAVLTASADCSVRVWSVSGDYVGTFGGTESQWLLTLPNVMSVEEARNQAHTAVETSDSGPGQDAAVPATEVNTTGDEPERATPAAVADDQKAADGPAGALTNLSVLGKYLPDQLRDRTKEKKENRKNNSITFDVSKTSQQGFSFCTPFQALETTELHSIKAAREPSASVRSRQRQAQGSLF